MTTVTRRNSPHKSTVTVTPSKNISIIENESNEYGLPSHQSAGPKRLGRKLVPKRALSTQENYGGLAARRSTVPAETDTNFFYPKKALAVATKFK